MEIIKLGLDELKPYEKNAKRHPEKQIEQIKKSIEQFGNNDPIAVWGDDNTIVEGHGRYIALKELGYTEAECIRLDHLTDEERKAYTLAHNKLTMNSDFDFDLLNEELDSILDLDMGEFGFEGLEETDFFRRENRNDTSRQDGNEEYNEFLDKFEAKKTTDDCYTPDVVYDAVANFVAEEYGLNKNNFVRPFYPNGNYQKEKYENSDIVVDNPPFSILSEILNFYNDNNIKFFLFAPTLTLFSSSPSSSSCAIPIGVTVTYENGANVDTSFLTNIETENRVKSSPKLYRAVNEANKQNLKEQKRESPKYEYCDYIVTSPRVGQFSRYGIEFCVPREESQHIRQMDCQKDSGKAIFGSGYLVSERVMFEKQKAEREKAEREKAEREKAERWELSEREMEIVKTLAKNED